MSGLVEVLPSGHRFQIEREEPILEAALRSGLALGYGCSNGTCGDCKARIVTGQVRDVRFHDYALTEGEKSAGYALLCCATAQGDLVIEVSEATGPKDIPSQSARVRVTKLDHLGAEHVVVHLKVQRGGVLRFLAGQSVKLAAPPALPPTRIAIASCPCDGTNLRFHVDLTAPDPVSAYVATKLRKGDKLTLTGPFGDVTLDDGSSRALLFIADGTGIAPLLSLIEHAINLELEQPIFLLWAAQRPGGHYLHNYCRSLADAFDAFTYCALSPEPGQTTPAACVAEALSPIGDLSHFDTYLAGPTDFCAELTLILQQHGLPDARLFQPNGAAIIVGEEISPAE